MEPWWELAAVPGTGAWLVEELAVGVGADTGLAGGRGGESAEEVAEFGADLLEPGFDAGVAGAAFNQRQLRRFGAELAGFEGEDLARAGDGVSLVVEEAADAHGEFDIALAIEALAGAAFVGAHLREFGFPETQDIGFDTAEARDFADAEIKLVGNDGFVAGTALGCVFGHRLLRELPRFSGRSIGHVTGTEQRKMRDQGLFFFSSMGARAGVWGGAARRYCGGHEVASPRAAAAWSGQ
jgi:hypothetical protein